MNKVYLLLAFAGFLGIGSALKCYQCGSTLDGVCGEDFKKNSTFEQPCEAEHDSCVKVVNHDKNTNVTTVLRGCAKEDKNCSLDANNRKTDCYFCKKDFCNTAAMPTSVSSLVYILPAALFLLTLTSKV